MNKRIVNELPLGTSRHRYKDRIHQLKETSHFSNEYKIEVEHGPSFVVAYVNLVSKDPSLLNEEYCWLVSIPQFKCSFKTNYTPSELAIREYLTEQVVSKQWIEDITKGIVSIINDIKSSNGINNERF